MRRGSCTRDVVSERRGGLDTDVQQLPQQPAELYRPRGLLHSLAQDREQHERNVALLLGPQSESGLSGFEAVRRARG